MSKTKETVQEEKWKIDDAVRTLMEYQKIVKDKELKEKAIKELKKRAEDTKEVVKDLS